jgi:hypothetical protein
LNRRAFTRGQEDFMKNLILTSALGSLALLITACGDSDADTEEDATVVETETPAAATASADWPAGARIVEDAGVTYRVNPDDTRVAIEDGSFRVVTVDGVRYRVDASGTGHRIDDDGLDLDLPAIEGIDIDLGTNKSGNLDLDVSTDGTDASTDRGDD